MVQGSDFNITLSCIQLKNYLEDTYVLYLIMYLHFKDLELQNIFHLQLLHGLVFNGWHVVCKNVDPYTIIQSIKVRSELHRQKLLIHYIRQANMFDVQL